MYKIEFYENQHGESENVTTIFNRRRKNNENLGRL